MLNKIRILFRSLYGYLLKGAYDLHILRIPSLGERETADCIVSLTSYGRRVQEGIVCYSIYSILRQTVQPKRIILWLSETEWNDTNLPRQVAALRDKGVEIRYCADMRSYKKLLPMIHLCPEDNIVTIDDDIIYPRVLIAQLAETHRMHPQAVIAPFLYKPLRTANSFAPYLTWPFDTPERDSLFHFPMGGTGCWYPPHCLKKEMLDYTITQQLAPNADDIWFWAAGIANGTLKYRTKWMYNLISFDAIYQFIHKGSALQHSNVKGNALTNDMQIAATMQFIKDQYGIS